MAFCINRSTKVSYLFLETLAPYAAHDPLIAFGLAVIALLIIPLGALHLFRIFCWFLVVLIREFKLEFLAIGKVLGRAKREVTTWRVDK